MAVYQIFLSKFGIFSVHSRCIWYFLFKFDTSFILLIYIIKTPLNSVYFNSPFSVHVKCCHNCCSIFYSDNGTNEIPSQYHLNLIYQFRYFICNPSNSISWMYHFLLSSIRSVFSKYHWSSKIDSVYYCGSFYVLKMYWKYYRKTNIPLSDVRSFERICKEQSNVLKKFRKIIWCTHWL